MSHLIAKQPDGKYALYSTGTDRLIMIDATAEQIIEHFIERETKRLRESVLETIAAIGAGQTDGRVHEAISWQDVIDSYAERWDERLDLDTLRVEWMHPQ